MTELITTQQQKHTTKDLIMDQVTWQIIREQGTVLVKSGLLPNSVKTPEAAIAIIMKGYELGMQPMQAFAHINIIQGKPTLSAEGMLAQIWKTIPNAIIDFVRVEDDYCEIHAARPGRTLRKFVFQKSDAVKAGLINKENWQKYPRAMYKARCISEMARTIFPDAIMGCSYTPEELSPDAVIVNAEGVIDVVETPPKSPQEIEHENRIKAYGAFNSKDPSDFEKLNKKLVSDLVPEDKHAEIAAKYHGQPKMLKILEDIIKPYLEKAETDKQAAAEGLIDNLGF